MAILKDFQYFAPVTVKDALRLLGKKGTILLAGGTFVLNSLKKTSRPPAGVVSLGRLKGLSGIGEAKASVSVGAMTRMADVAGSSVIQKYFPALAQGCARLGTTPIRNMATVGGNVASRFYWADLPAILISLEAKLVAETAKGKKIWSVEEFLAKRPAERFVLAQIVLSKSRGINIYCRHTKSMDVDIPSAALAFAAQFHGGCLRRVSCVVNTSLSLPVRCGRVSKLLEGQAARRIPASQVRSFLREDLAGTKLDEYRIRLLEMDLEGICGSLAEK